ncbi:hypothetical protein ACN47E_004326 [Coniothyrium glycines]
MELAAIEQLPVELLQSIFISADHNLALLKASPYIAARLSSEYVYKSTVDRYFSGIPNFLADAEAQTYLFASKWMTWAYFKCWVLRAFEAHGCLCASKECFDPQWPPDFEDATTMVFSRSHLPKLSFIRCRLPIKLLHGPWTQDKVQYLRFLLWTTSMSVDWRSEAAALAALRGRRDAMTEQNLEAVELFNHNRRLGRGASLSTIQFAVMKAGCNRSIVYDTMLAANLWGGIRGSCKELDDWACERTKAGDPKGQWVQTKLKELRDYNCHDYQDGKLNSTSGDYDGGADDRLIVHKLEWNEVSDAFHLLLPNRAHHQT